MSAPANDQAPSTVDIGTVIYDPAALGARHPDVLADVDSNARLHRMTRAQWLAQLLNKHLGPAFKIRPTA